MYIIEGRIVRADYQGRKISFFVNNSNDVIQAWHARGTFYEVEELTIISKWFRGGDVFLDVGANVGNHSLYVCLFLYARQSIVIEPNPPAMAILNANVDLNGLRGLVDTSLLGVGLSDVQENVVAHSFENNLGATRMIRSEAENGFRLVAGDTLFMGRKIDFIKIDVEGGEIKTLYGLSKVIEANRPRLFVEVENGHFDQFNNFVQKMHYRITDRYKRYESNENFMIVPVEY